MPTNNPLQTGWGNADPILFWTDEDADEVACEAEIVEFAEYAGISEDTAWDWYYSMEAGSFDDSIQEMYEQADKFVMEEAA